MPLSAIRWHSTIIEKNDTNRSMGQSGDILALQEATDGRALPRGWMRMPLAGDDGVQWLAPSKPAIYCIGLNYEPMQLNLVPPSRNILSYL